MPRPLSTILKIAGVATLLGAIVLVALLGASHHFTDRDLDSVLKSESERFETTAVLAAGCVAAGISDRNMAPAMAASRGMVCVQILQDTLSDAVHRRSVCDAGEGVSDRKKCLFSLGYVSVLARALNRMPETEEDYDTLRSDIDSAYGKINATKEQQ